MAFFDPNHGGLETGIAIAQESLGCETVVPNYYSFGETIGEDFTRGYVFVGTRPAEGDGDREKEAGSSTWPEAFYMESIGARLLPYQIQWEALQYDYEKNEGGEKLLMPELPSWNGKEGDVQDFSCQAGAFQDQRVRVEFLVEENRERHVMRGAPRDGEAPRRRGVAGQRNREMQGLSARGVQEGANKVERKGRHGAERSVKGGRQVPSSSREDADEAAFDRTVGAPMQMAVREPENKKRRLGTRVNKQAEERSSDVIEVLKRTDRGSKNSAKAVSGKPWPLMNIKRNWCYQSNKTRRES